MTRDQTSDGPGLRERKKAQTRSALHRAALELARAAASPDDVTVDAIAERADVSARTFFNYYPSKEAAFAGLDPDLPEALAAALLARPQPEATSAAVRAVLEEHLAQRTGDKHWWDLRADVARRSPDVAALLMGTTARMERTLMLAAIERLGLEPQDAPLEVFVEAFGAIAAYRAGMWFHRTHGSEGDPVERVREAYTRMLPGG